MIVDPIIQGRRNLALQSIRASSVSISRGTGHAGNLALHTIQGSTIELREYLAGSPEYAAIQEKIAGLRSALQAADRARQSAAERQEVQGALEAWQETARRFRADVLLIHDSFATMAFDSARLRAARAAFEAGQLSEADAHLDPAELQEEQTELRHLRSENESEIEANREARKSVALKYLIKARLSRLLANSDSHPVAGNTTRRYYELSLHAAELHPACLEFARLLLSTGSTHSARKLIERAEEIAENPQERNAALAARAELELSAGSIAKAFELYELLLEAASAAETQGKAASREEIARIFALCGSVAAIAGQPLSKISAGAVSPEGRLLLAEKRLDAALALFREDFNARPTPLSADFMAALIQRARLARRHFDTDLTLACYGEALRLMEADSETAAADDSNQATNPDNLHLRAMRLEAGLSLAEIRTQENDPTSAEELDRIFRLIPDRTAAPESESLELQGLYSRAHQIRARRLSYDLRYRDALDEYRQTLDLLEPCFADSPGDYRLQLGAVLLEYADLLLRARLQGQALQILQRAQFEFENLAAQDPHRFQTALAAVRCKLARILIDLDDRDHAENLIGSAIDSLKSRPESPPFDPAASFAFEYRNELIEMMLADGEVEPASVLNQANRAFLDALAKFKPGADRIAMQARVEFHEARCAQLRGHSKRADHFMKLALRGYAVLSRNAPRRYVYERCEIYEFISHPRVGSAKSIRRAAAARRILRLTGGIPDFTWNPLRTRALGSLDRSGYRVDRALAQLKGKRVPPARRRYSPLLWRFRERLWDSQFGQKFLGRRLKKITADFEADFQSDVWAESKEAVGAPPIYSIPAPTGPTRMPGQEQPTKLEVSQPAGDSGEIVYYEKSETYGTDVEIRDVHNARLDISVYLNHSRSYRELSAAIAGARAAGSPELEGLLKRQREFQKNVRQLAATFADAGLDSEIARETHRLFLNGDFEAANVALDPSALYDEQQEFLLQRDRLQARSDEIQKRLNNNATEYLLKARLTALRYELPDRIDLVREYLQRSIQSADRFDNNEALANFLATNFILEAAAKHFERAVELAPDLESRVRVLGNSASIYWRRHDFEGTRKRLTLALATLERMEDFQTSSRSEHAAWLHMMTAMSYAYEHERDAALHHAERALELLGDGPDRDQAPGDPESEDALTIRIRVWLTIGKCHKDSQAFDPALEAYQRALDCARRLRDESGPNAYLPQQLEAFSLLGLTTLHCDQVVYDPRLRDPDPLDSEAARFAHKAVESWNCLVERSPRENEYNLSVVLEHFGDYLVEHEYYEEARSWYYDRLLDIRRRLATEDPLSGGPHLSRLYSSMGILHARLKEYEQALEYYRDACKIDRGSLRTNFNGFASEALRNLQNLADLLRATGDFSGAEEQYREMENLARSADHKFYLYKALIGRGECYAAREEKPLMISAYDDATTVLDEILAERTRAAYENYAESAESAKNPTQTDSEQSGNRAQFESLLKLGAELNGFFAGKNYDRIREAETLARLQYTIGTELLLASQAEAALEKFQAARTWYGRLRSLNSQEWESEFADATDSLAVAYGLVEDRANDAGSLHREAVKIRESLARNAEPAEQALANQDLAESLAKYARFQWKFQTKKVAMRSIDQAVDLMYELSAASREPNERFGPLFQKMREIQADFRARIDT